MKFILANLLCIVCLGARAADIFADVDGNPALFGIRLGQTVSFDDAELVARYRLCTNGVYRHSRNFCNAEQWECCGFTPEPEYRDPQFRGHRIFIDGASRQVVAVDAEFESKSPFRAFAPASGHFTNMLARAFRRYGQCETRLSSDLWQSGEIFWTTFFISSGAGVIISHHTQFGEELCLCRVPSCVRVIGSGRTGCILPERCPGPSFRKEEFCKKMGSHPALQLYEQYRSRRQSAIGILEKRFAISAAKLKSERIPQPVWEHVFLKKGTGKFGSIVMNGKDSAWKIQAYNNSTVAVECHLRLFDSAAKTYDYGMDLLTSRLLPGEALCGKFSLAEGVPDICLVAPRFEFDSWGDSDARTTVLLMRGNCVLECKFNGKSSDYAADAAGILDFFVKKSGVVQVGEGEVIMMRDAK